MAIYKHLCVSLCFSLLSATCQDVELDNRNQSLTTTLSWQKDETDETAINNSIITNANGDIHPKEETTLAPSSNRISLRDLKTFYITETPNFTQIATREPINNSTKALQNISLPAEAMPERLENTNSTTSSPIYPINSILQFRKNFQYVHDMFILPCLCPFGIIGNSMVAHTLVQQGKAKTANRYMITILVTDVCSLISDIILPIARVFAQSDSWSVKEIAAHAYYYTSDGFSFFCRRFNLNVFCVLSVERMIAITKPFEVKQSITSTKFHWFIVASFIMAVLQSVPVMNVEMKPVYNEADDYTSFVVRLRHELLPKWYLNNSTAAISILDGPIQILFVVILNVLIVGALKKRKKSVAFANDRSKVTSLSNHQKKIVKIFLVMSTTNILAFLPKPCGIIINTFLKTNQDQRVPPWLVLVVSGSHFLRVFNSLTDFIVFLAVSREIRRDVKKIIICEKKE